MTPPPSTPNRRRILIAAALLALVSAWWLWPRVDPRFVGAWDVLPAYDNFLFGGEGRLVLTDWLPPWSGWDDAVCLVFDGGVHDAGVAEQIVPQAREIVTARFCTLAEVHHLCADFTARRVRAAVGGAQPYTESGR